uniref:LIM zinc-binding domain-containing protein n=1 Tax=Parascaris univalens TaxID=6257 RepID=A0A914ZIM7_PARUN
MADVDEDPYALSSDSEDDEPKGPPPKINIEGRAVTDLSSLKAALTETKEAVVDDKRLEELNELKAKSEIAKIKKDFIEGNIKREEDGEKPVDEEREKLTAIAKETYSKFKDKFEKMPETLEQNLEERLKSMEKELTGVGKENLANIKGAFENPQEQIEIEREAIVVERSEADKKRIMSTFVKPEMTAEDAPRECAVCSKIVYPVERIFANKCLYHNTCFKCFKCAKKLTPTNYNSHQGQLLCKVHYLEIFHPEIAKTMDPNTTEEDERRPEDEDEEYAVSSKPKQLGADVVRSGVKAADDLSQIGSLKERKCDWESSAKEAATVDKKTVVDDEIAAGKVKANLERFVKGAINDGEEEEEDDTLRDPNIIREDRKKHKEELNFGQVGDIKNKWKTGNVEGAEVKELSKEDLEELRKGPGVKERFKERTDEEEMIAKQWDRSELDTSAVADARRSFLEGSAYQSAPIEKTVEMSEIEFKKLQEFKDRFEKGEGDISVEKTAVDIHAEGLGDIKAAFEKGGIDEANMTPEERAELKKKEIEAEFLRYKLARRAAAQREAAEQEQGEGAPASGIEVPTVELGSIKDRFETGDAFKGQETDKSQLDVEIKMAGKAREKFKQIDAEGPSPTMPNQPKEKRISKWDKKENAPVPEPINKRIIEDEPEELEEEDAYAVKNLMNKFKNIEKEPIKLPTHERPLDLEGIKVEAKNLKEQFEKVGDHENESAEEKRKRLEDEFARLKQEKEAAAAAREPSPEEEIAPQKEEIHVAADHASKMAAKWEKIQKKEAKKAERSKMPQKASAQAIWNSRIRAPPPCDCCGQGVYMAERFECFSHIYHQRCFRCKHCGSPLRAENSQRSPSGDLFCETHFRRLFIAHNSFVFRSNQQFIVST